MLPTAWRPRIRPRSSTRAPRWTCLRPLSGPSRSRERVQAETTAANVRVAERDQTFAAGSRATGNGTDPAVSPGLTRRSCAPNFPLPVPSTTRAAPAWFGARYGWRRVRVKVRETAGSAPFHRCSNALAGSGALSCPLYAHPLTLLGSPAASGALPRAAPARSQCRGAGQRARSHAAGGPCPPPARWLQPQPASPSAKHLGPFAAALSVRLHGAFPRHFRAGRGTHRPLTSRRDGARAAQ